MPFKETLSFLGHEHCLLLVPLLSAAPMGHGRLPLHAMALGQRPLEIHPRSPPPPLDMPQQLVLAASEVRRQRHEL
ncbi:hypothetical protein PAHAL_9G110400 [Panicum hallii]|uniref:Uncharacterized protein n=1 Tax=Panicum hallii TaxID=206008 RepID=A0A2S3IIM2_9POAL|nr:hypothetical protein PAHAL_9G110400 [Panicum hallii]